MRILHFILFYFVLSTCTQAQDSLILYKSISASGLDKASQDSYGNLYICDKKGNINKYDSLGTFLLNYSPQKLGNVTLIEASNTIKIFVFYRDFQEYTLLERFLGPMPNSAFNQDDIGFARQATLASDYNLWVIDDTDFSLKKYDRQFNKVLNKTALDLILDARDYDITFLREYQSNLYLCDKLSGILVFDSFGSYKKKIPFKGIDFFSFHDDELYYLQNDSLHFFHLYLFNTREIALPINQKYFKVFFFNQKVYAIRPNGIDIYRTSKQ
jgi:hypothetical protein